MVQHTRNRGQIVVELLVAFGLAGILLPALLTGLIGARSGRVQQEQRILAVGLLREGEEAVRSARDAVNGWNKYIATNGIYKPVVSDKAWTLVSTIPAGSPEQIGDFTRKIEISDLAPIDLSLKKITVTVSWSNILPTNVSSTFYLTRWKNLVYLPIPAHGTLSGMGYGDWCNPSATPAAELSLAGGLNVVSVAQGSSDVISFVGSGKSANGLTYADINITDPPHPTPPAPTILGSVVNTPQIKTNGAFNDVSYGYLAADQHSKSGQGLIIDLSKIVTDPSHSIVGTLDTDTNANGQSIYVANNIAYLTDDEGYLYAFNISTRSGPHIPISGSKIQLAGVGNKIVVDGTKAKAYVATNYVLASSTPSQLQIVNVSTPNLPQIIASVNVGNGKNGVDVFVDKDRLRAYLVTPYASPDFFTIDVNPADVWYKQVINTFLTTNNMNPTGVVAVTGSRAVIVGKDSSRNYQVIDISSENVPPPSLSPCGAGGLNVSYNINAIATLFTNAQRAYSYILTTDSKEYKIIEGGPGGGGGGNGGTFESDPFDCRKVSPVCTSPVIFNSFSEIPSPIPPGVTTSYQIAVALAPNCDTATYIYGDSYGPSGGQIPLSINPGYCFRYKVTFKNAGEALSASTAVQVNYSP